MVAQKSKAISILLKDIYRKSSETPEQWENTSSKFEELWKFLICSEQLMPSLSELKVQEILGPFIAIVKDFSVLLYWQFAMLTTVLAGSNNDSGVLANSSVGKRFESGTFNLPRSKPLHGCTVIILI